MYFLNLILSVWKKDEKMLFYSILKIVCKPFKKIIFMLIKYYTSKEIIPDLIEIHGTTVIWLKEVKLCGPYIYGISKHYERILLFNRTLFLQGTLT